MKRQFSIYGALAAFTLFWGMLTGCEADDTPGGSSSSELVPVTISLQTDEVDQLTKAVDEDAINTLDVYIYNGSTVEKHLTETDFTNNVATVDLTTGQKTIRAVANANRTTETTFDACTWITNNNEMPMSTTKDTTWNVSSSHSEYEVRLNRMVAKMNVKIVDERADQTTNTVSAVTISDLMIGTTNLYREGYGEVSLPDNVTKSAWSPSNIQSVLSDDGETFYLHENSGTFPISVTVGTDSRTGNLEANIPRNHIFPLVIHLTDYSLDIDVEYQLAAIGTLPVTKELNTYSFELPEGCTYKVTVTPKKNMTGGWNEGATWTWTEPEFELSNSSITFDGTPSWPNNSTLGAESKFIFTGKISALYQENDKVEFLITLKDETMIKDYPLVITTRPLGNDELTNTRSYSVSAETEAVHIDL